MADKKISVDEMLAQIREWHTEVTNFRNDGWMQKGYREKIEMLHGQISTMVNTIQLTTDEELVGNVTDADGNTTPVSNRSVGKRYSGDPRNKDS